MSRKYSKVNRKNFLEKAFSVAMTFIVVFNMCSLNFLALNPVAKAAEINEVITEKEVDKIDSEEESEEEETKEETAPKEEAEKEETTPEQEIEEEGTAPAEEIEEEKLIPEKEAEEEEIVNEEEPKEEENKEETAPAEEIEEEQLIPEKEAEEEETKEETVPKEEAEKEETAPAEEIEEEKAAPKWEMSDNDKVAKIGPVEKDVKYIAPQNDQVTITFTKLPEDVGSLTIEEVTLTKEQVEELGALSNKAYDITSSMKNGTFEYDLTLPKPKEVKEVQIKYAESEDKLNDIKTIEEDVNVKDDEVKADGVNHFTLFIVTADLSVLSVVPTINNVASVVVNSGITVRANLEVGIPWPNTWLYTKYKIGSEPWENVNTPDHYAKFLKTETYSEEFDIIAPTAEGSYDIEFRACGLLHCSNIKTLNEGIIVDDTAPVITLDGANPQTIEMGSGYTELGATTDDGSAVIIDSSEFVDAIGTYSIYYDATDGVNAATQVVRTVKVVDTTAPTVKITSPIASLLNGFVEVRGTVTDSNPHHYWLQIKKNGTVISSKTVNESNSFVDRLFTTLTDDGDYEVTLAARDAVGGTASSGNRSANVVKSFIIDNTAPATPTGLRRIAPDENGKIYECGDVSKIQQMWPDRDDNTEADFSHY